MEMTNFNNSDKIHTEAEYTHTFIIVTEVNDLCTCTKTERERALRTKVGRAGQSGTIYLYSKTEEDKRGL